MIQAREDGAGPMNCGERWLMEYCNAMGSGKSRRLVSSAQTDRFLMVSRRSMTISFTLLSACVVSSFTNVGATAHLEAPRLTEAPEGWSSQAVGWAASRIAVRAVDSDCSVTAHWALALPHGMV